MHSTEHLRPMSFYYFPEHGAGASAAWYARCARQCGGDTSTALRAYEDRQFYLAPLIGHARIKFLASTVARAFGSPMFERPRLSSPNLACERVCRELGQEAVAQRLVWREAELAHVSLVEAHHDDYSPERLRRARAAFKDAETRAVAEIARRMRPPIAHAWAPMAAHATCGLGRPSEYVVRGGGWGYAELEMLRAAAWAAEAMDPDSRFAGSGVLEALAAESALNAASRRAGSSGAEAERAAQEQDLLACLRPW